MTTPTPRHDTVADQLAIRRVIDAYAHHADFREPELQYGLYAENGRTLVYPGPDVSEPQVLTTREEHLAGFGALSQYAVTTHVNGQSTIDVHGQDATAETYCLAHHLLENESGRTLTVMSIRYEDTLTRTRKGWRFTERRLHITWTDSRPSQP